MIDSFPCISVHVAKMHSPAHDIRREGRGSSEGMRRTGLKKKEVDLGSGLRGATWTKRG